MGLSFTDPDQWYEEYESASLERRYDILMETLDQPLSENFIEEADLGGCLIDMMGALASNNLIAQALDFIDRFQIKQPDLYSKEFQYHDDFLVQYYLHRGEREKVVESLSRFMADPAHDLDQMIPLLDYLRFYGYTDVVVELCRKAYIPIKESAKYIPGAEDDLGIILFTDMADRAYRRIRGGETVDWGKFIKQAEKYGYGGGQEMADEIEHLLTEEMEGGETFTANFNRDRGRCLNTLTWAFLKYMLDQKNMDFVCSEHIIDGVLEFLGERKLRSQKSVSPNVYFGFPKKELDSHIAQMIGGFLSMRQAEGVGILWGVAYVYDFLLSKDAIARSTHRSVIRSVDSLKADLMNAFQKSLWRYSFVHRWTPPDSVSDEYFAAESEIFSKTIEVEVPLGDKPVGPMDFLRQFVDMELPSDLIASDAPSRGPAARKKKKPSKSSAKRRRKKKKKKRKR